MTLDRCWLLGSALLAGTIAAADRHAAPGPFFGSPVISSIQAASTALNDGYPIDFDSDGDTDLILSPLAPPTYPATAVALRAFRNDGSGRFTEATAEVLGTVPVVHARDFRTADLNGDGRLDLFIADHGTDVLPFPGGQSRILIQTAAGTFGMIASQLGAGVFEFHKLPGAPAGVVLQSSGQTSSADQAMRLTLRLGNSSLLRQRVTILVHSDDFSDLHACTFWVPPGRPLWTFSIRTYSTMGRGNATASVYPATPGSGSPYQWLTLDDVSLSRIEGPVAGTRCQAPGDVVNNVR